MTGATTGTDDAQVLLTRREGAVEILQINRPAAYNALDREVMGAVTEAVERIRDDDDVRAVILTGSTRFFCAGADITAFDDLRAEPLLGSRRAAGGRIWTDLATLNTPVIAAVEGPALGGGFELALACDTIVAGRSARFALPEVSLGVIPGGGGTQRLVRAVGKARAMALLMTGDTIDAEKAERFGVVTEVVEDGCALDAALAMAERICRNSPLAVALAKDAGLAASEMSLAAGLEHEKRNFHIAVRSEDCREGQAAFLAKRAPHFTGR